MTAGRKPAEIDWATDLDLPSRRLAQEFDVLDALPQLIECGLHARQQGATEWCGFDAARATVEQSHAQRCFKTSDNRRHRWLRDAQFGRGLSHAAALGDREEDVQLAQLEATTDVLFPMDMTSHSPTSMEVVANRAFYL